MDQSIHIRYIKHIGARVAPLWLKIKQKTHACPINLKYLLSLSLQSPFASLDYRVVN